MRRAVPLRHLLLVGLALSACTNRSGDDSSSSSSSGTPASSSSGGVVSSGSGSGTQSSSRANSSGVNSSSRANSSGPATSTGTSNPGSGSSAAGGSSTSTQSSAGGTSTASGGNSSSTVGSSNGGVSGTSTAASSGTVGSSGAGGSSSGVVGSSSSGGSSSGVVITTLAEYCDAISNLFCTPPSCTYSGENPPRVDCLRGYAHACPIFVDQLTAEQAAGQRSFDPAAATSCINNVFGVYTTQLELGCLDPANPNSNTVLYETYYGTVSCAAGAPTYRPGLFQTAQQLGNVCDRVTPGLVQGAGTCGNDDVCASSSCDNRPDGGCGSCAPVVDAGPTLLPGNVDEPCILDGGTQEVRPGCVLGLACNDDSDNCEPFVGQDAPCGPGIRGVCSGACGQRCVTTPDGGFCKPAAALGDACSFSDVFCAQGLSCTPGHDDAGVPLFPASRCTAQAALNDNCSTGYTMEGYPQIIWPFTGAFSFGRFPACAANLRCNAPEGQPDGVCVAITAAATGAPCDTTLPFNCATRGDRCVDEGDGGRACRPRGLAGAVCTSNDDCGVNLFCSGGQCTGLRGEGQPCDFDGECAGAALCQEHACILLEHVGALGLVCQ